MKKSQFDIALSKLAGAIIDAENKHTYNCLNGSTAMQVGSSQRIDNLKYAFAIITDTAVNGIHFNALLNMAKKEYQT